MRRLLPFFICSLFLAACNSAGHSPLAPASQGASPTTPLPAGLGATPERIADTGEGALGVFDAVLDFGRGTVALTPRAPERTAEKISDIYAPDLTPYISESPCSDCFKVKAFSQDPDGNLLVDFGLSHPFPSIEKRRDLDLFDTRAIVIVDGETTFPATPKIQIDGDGIGDRTVQGNFDLVMNADGYTHHFDRKVEDTRFFNPPLDIAGSVNPFIQFFTESDPSPTRTGFPIPNHRFAQTPVQDVQRFAFRMPQGQATQLRVIIVLEVGYGASATWAQTRDFPGSIGSRTNPAYFLPAFNQAEAYRVSANFTGSFTEGDPPETSFTIPIEVEDWQAGLVGSPSYGDTNQLGEIPLTSDVERVTVELPGMMNGIEELTRLGGIGRFGDPYRYEWTIRNDLGAPAGDYIGLIAVSDSMDGSGFRITVTPGELYYSFTAWQTIRVKINEDGNPNQPPIAVADAQPNPVISGADVALIDHDSFDPDAGDAIVKYEWDFDVADGRDYTDSSSATPDAAVTSYTNTGTLDLFVTASLRVTDTFGASDTEDISIRVKPPVAGNNPPVAVPEADPTPVVSGTIVALKDDQSFDPDPGDSIILYEWDFDVANGRDYTDSISGTANVASTIYTNLTSNPIQITASLRVSDTQGATDFEDVVITVEPVPVGTNNPPVAVAEAIETTVETGALVEFIDSNSFDPDAGDFITEYAWDFDVANGRTYTDSVSNLVNRASTTYTNATANPILITASLRVKDSFGATDTEDIVITVNPTPVGQNRPPVAVAEALKTTVDSGELVEFFDSNSYDPDPFPDKVVEYAWDYNIANGATYTDSVSTLPNRAKTTYTNATMNPVQITASLRVKDTFGLTDTEDIVITVNPAPAPSCPDPLQAPSAFRMGSWPTPPYTTNPINFAWTAPPDPLGCLRGYTVWRSTRVGPDNTWKLLTDLDGDNLVDANELILTTTWTDITWSGAGDPTTNKYYMYVVRTISDGPSGSLITSLDSNRVFVYVNGFEGMSQLTGGTFRGTRSGMSWGLVNAWAYPDINAFNYGFEIATNLGNTGTHCLDESADIAAGGYGPTNHSPYAAGSNFDDFIDDGYWNTFGPQLFTDLDTNPFSSATFRQMQLFHKYQMETYFDPDRGVEVAADMGYVTVTPHADWEANRFNKLIDLPVVEGKDYDSAAPGVNPFLDQQYWPAADRDPTKQIPKMNFLAGDFRTPEAGAPNWTRSVFDMTPARNMTQPVVQFCFAGDEYAQVASHIGWSIDDILVVAY